VLSLVSLLENDKKYIKQIIISNTKVDNLFKIQVLVVFEKIINKTFGCIVINVVTLQHNKKPPPGT
jgi:hypothetical protein